MAYANALRTEYRRNVTQANQQVTYGYRSRSSDILVPELSNYHEVMDAILTNPKVETEITQIHSIFQIGKSCFNMTFHQEAEIEILKETFLTKFEDGVETANGKLEFIRSRMRSVVINLRAVPVEVENQKYIQRFRKYNCGNIKNIKMINYRETNIHNGYRIYRKFYRRKDPAFCVAWEGSGER